MTTTPSTSTQSLKTLAKSILNRLENRKFIEFNPRERNSIQEALYSRLKKNILTEDDLNAMVREQVAKASESISEQNITETEAYQSQKKALKAKFADNAIQGFYLKSALRTICKDTCKFLFECSEIDEVFESDEAIEKLVIETIQTFDESKIS